MTENKIHLLAIDDDDINIFIIKKILEKTGFEVSFSSSSNGQEAFDYLSGLISSGSTFPQLILVDINMPVLNGWDFLSAYEKLDAPKNVHIYMLSSSVYENDIEKAKSFRTVKGFISKPLSIDRLSELLRLIDF
ncbi:MULTISPECIES: response regulator [Pedobacter]|uniref:response regulator n=1 Tax=Pedobacter TaxID=84567 RepID=UPI00210CAB2D|nr:MULTISPECIES: response regulator [unclassified Pedobacter]